MLGPYITIQVEKLNNTTADVAHMDAISAKDAQVASAPRKEKTSPYIRLAGPPFISPPWNVLFHQISRKLIHIYSGYRAQTMQMIPKMQSKSLRKLSVK